MQGFIHLVLLALLFITSVTGQGSMTASPSTPDTGDSTGAKARASVIMNAGGSRATDKAFYGTFRMKESYTTEFEKKKSEAYKNLQWTINEFFDKGLESLPGYLNTIIDKVSPFYSPIVGLDVGEIYVTVVHVFEEGTVITEEKVTENVNKVFEGQVNFSEYSSKTFRGTFRMKEAYKTEFENKQSEDYKKLHLNIYKFFAKAFESPTGYIDTIIDTVSPSYSTGFPVEEKTYVIVVHIFKEETTITQDEINQKVNAVLNGEAFIDYNSKEFPGTFRMKESYKTGFENKQSEEYKNLHSTIYQFFTGTFESGYIDTIIDAVSPSYLPISYLHDGEMIYVTVVHIFKKDTPLTEEQVTEIVNNAFVAQERFTEANSKEFPGTFRMKESYKTEFDNKQSEDYKNLHSTIFQFFAGAFESGYMDTIIDTVSPSISPISGLPNEEMIYVTVVHIFEKGTPIIGAQVSAKVDKAFVGQEKFTDANSMKFSGTFRMNESYRTDFQNKQSADYKNLHLTIYQFFAKAFESPPGYIDTIIDSVSPSISPISGLLNEEMIYVTVGHIFKKGTPIIEVQVAAKVDKAFVGQDMFTDANSEKFPGTFRMKEPYTTEFENKESEAYRNLHSTINTFFAGAFKTGYLDTIIDAVSPSNSPISGLYNGEMVYMTVGHIFKKGTPIIGAQVNATVDKAFEGQDNFTDPNNIKFPGTFRMKESYKTNFENKQSEDYKILHSNISQFFAKAFESPPGYIDTIIDSVSPSYSPGSGLPNREMIYVTVSYIFKKGTPLIEAQVTTKVDKAFAGQDRFTDSNSMKFPVTFRLKESYTSDFEVKESEAYMNLHSTIYQFFTGAFESGYIDTIIDAVSPSNPPISGLHNEEMIYVTVRHIFKEGTPIIGVQVNSRVDKAFVGQLRFTDSNNKKFPGTFRMKEPYTTEFENKESEAYRNLHSTINKFFTGAFDSGYIDTIIDAVRPSNSPKSGLRNREKIYVNVMHIFKENTSVTEEQVNEKVNNASVGQDIFTDYNSKEFPGTFRMKESYTTDFENEESQAYKILNSTINEFFQYVLQPDSQKTIINTISPSDSPRYGLRNGEKIYVTVVHILNKDTILTEQKVTEKVNTALLGDDRFSDYNRQLRPCEKHGCIGVSTCVNLNDTSFCLCQEGYYHKENKCHEGKVFLGKITINASYIPELKNNESLAYQELYWNMTNFFAGVFTDTDYGQTIIRKVRKCPLSPDTSGYMVCAKVLSPGTRYLRLFSPSVSARYDMRATETIEVTIENILKKDTILTEMQVTTKIEEKIKDSNIFLSYTDQIRPCDLHVCNAGSCVNLHNDSFCQCQDGYYYKNGQCLEGKVFPGKLKMEASDIAKLEDKESLTYQMLHYNISKFFEAVFLSDYGQTVIYKVSPSTSARYGMRAAENVEVTVVNILKNDTQLMADEVYTKINKAVEESKMFLSYSDQVYPCDYIYCSFDSSCINLNDMAFCLCPEGYYYKEDKCNRGKVFPGKLELQTSYIPELENKTSLAYQNLHVNITQFFAGVFNASEYGQTVIHKVSPSTSEKYNLHVEATVVNILNKDSKLTEEQVTKVILAEAENLHPKILSYSGQSLCDYYSCEQNDSINCADSLKCVCKSGMYRPNPQASRCIPDLCPQSCTSKYNKHCQWDVTLGLAKCVCLPDYMEDGNGICQKCAFGYSGVNCQDKLQLILTLMGSIAGVCILILVIAVIIMGLSLRSKKDYELQVLVENDFQKLTLQQNSPDQAQTEDSPLELTPPLQPAEESLQQVF